MSDKGFGLIRNWVPVRTLKFDVEVGVLLSEGSGIFVRWPERRI